MQPCAFDCLALAAAALRLRPFPLHAPTGMVAVEAGMAAGGTAVTGVGRPRGLARAGWGWRPAGWRTSIGRGGRG
jgi:hypothetical protein